ncbi:MAG TPA: tetratricopeptide repeat protein [Thermodesulfobacteriota bacterium]|nr:tetratricopeptide repeat protein [Thermodesulfobacteriota bacterium]
MRFGFSLIIIISISLLGCAVKREDVVELYERQASLELKLDKISKDVETLKKDTEEKEKRISRIEKNQARNYVELKQKLDELAKNDSPRFSSSDKSSSDLFSTAESYYQKGAYEDAIISYQKFIATYPNDNRVPQSYLKQGLSLVNLGKSEEAKFFFQTLISKFPDSEEAKIARRKLKEIEEKRS